MPMMTYGIETLVLNKTITDTLAVAQCKMERIMLGIILCNKRTNADQSKGYSNDYQGREAQIGWQCITF
jgi:hypothetical protein